MTTYVLSLAGGEAKAACATRWARFRNAKLLSVSRKAGDGRAADTGRGNAVAAAPASADRFEARRPAFARDPEALAALLVRTLDMQDGSGVVLADFDSEDFAAAVMARIAALGRDVTCRGQVADFGSGAGVWSRFARP